MPVPAATCCDLLCTAGIDDVTPKQALQEAKGQLITANYGQCDTFIAQYKKVCLLSA